MKKLFILLAIAMVVLTACEDKNSQENNQAGVPKIIGEWVLLDSNGQPDGEKGLFSDDMWYDIFEINESTYTHLVCAGEFDGNTFYRTASNTALELPYTIHKNKFSNGILTYKMSFPDDDHLVLSAGGDKEAFMRITVIDL